MISWDMDMDGYGIAFSMLQLTPTAETRVAPVPWSVAAGASHGLDPNPDLLRYGGLRSLQGR